MNGIFPYSFRRQQLCKRLFVVTYSCCCPKHFFAMHYGQILGKELQSHGKNPPRNIKWTSVFKCVTSSSTVSAGRVWKSLPSLGLDVASGSMTHDPLFTLAGGTVLLSSTQREAGPTFPKEQWQIAIGFSDDNC